LDAIVSDFAEEAVILSATGVVRGREEVRKAFARLLDDLPQAAWDLKTTLFEGDVLYLEWAATAEGHRVDDGVDTFIFDDGLIRLQTIHYTVKSA
jgi:predicted SnoaL-like aldol condensation-catalyzing enzyme